MYSGAVDNWSIRSQYRMNRGDINFQVLTCHIFYRDVVLFLDPILYRNLYDILYHILYHILHHILYDNLTTYFAMYFVSYFGKIFLFGVSQVNMEYHDSISKHRYATRYIFHNIIFTTKFTTNFTAYLITYFISCFVSYFISYLITYLYINLYNSLLQYFHRNVVTLYNHICHHNFHDN